MVSSSAPSADSTPVSGSEGESRVFACRGRSSPWYSGMIVNQLHSRGTAHGVALCVAASMACAPQLRADSGPAIRLLPPGKQLEVSWPENEFGYRVEWHEYAMPHTLCAQEVADIGNWLANVLAV